ncbi:hypothetical protein T11_16022 [Trichinella zimbabwensis]|uniref:Uncharacterized protein n=1 Tax=Trichinella zimbabwensis TaxID=268475 RepID=A0A0V1HDC2_9BILA|nr:hypothetical protein T11_6093 [Trichinella zimbabwensis]KRZ11669.1 hypothetical protein T11_16022 [Trichinella zimbabwensis]
MFLPLPHQGRNNGFTRYAAFVHTHWPSCRSLKQLTSENVIVIALHTVRQQPLKLKPHRFKVQASGEQQLQSTQTSRPRFKICESKNTASRSNVEHLPYRVGSIMFFMSHHNVVTITRVRLWSALSKSASSVQLLIFKSGQEKWLPASNIVLNPAQDHGEGTMALQQKHPVIFIANSRIRKAVEIHRSSLLQRDLNASSYHGYLGVTRRQLFLPKFPLFTQLWWQWIVPRDPGLPQQVRHHFRLSPVSVVGPSKRLTKCSPIG